MRLRHIYILSGLAMMTSACSDFLDKKPLSDNVDEGFFTAENQLEPYCNAKYDFLPDHGTGTGTFGYFLTDNNSDNQANVTPNDNFIPQRIQVPASGSYGNFSAIRDCNRFLTQTAQNLENGTLTNSTNVQQYIGEMYFFRAYIYFSFLKSYGDFPIITEVLTDGDYAANVEANKRKPRNEVARFILGDLDLAIEKLQPKSNNITNHRINRETALLFKSRVALYEASWEKYHSGTARVPGGPGWPGGTFSGNLDTEITFFLSEAMEAAKTIADAITLQPSYEGLFNKTDYSDQNEILLWRMYSADAKVQNQVVGATHGYLMSKDSDGNTVVRSHGSNTGYTRSLVESYIMNDGLPWYASPLYQGDESLDKVVADRDSRLVSSMLSPGDKIISDGNGDVMFQFPGFTSSGSITLTTTGYIPRKGWMDNDVYINSPYPLGLPIFRAAEAYLNYIEADCMMDGTLDPNSDMYWKALRKRAGVDTDYMKTVNATDLSKEIDLAKYSGTETVSALMYNIRRERRSEFIAEGLRKDDLYRWRALDMMKNYQVEGMNYWAEMASAYEKVDNTFNPVPKEQSTYLRPYWNNAAVNEFGGYNFEVANYLSPLSYDVFRLSTPEEGGDVSTSVVYQNHGWPVEAGGFAIK